MASSVLTAILSTLLLAASPVASANATAPLAITLFSPSNGSTAGVAGKGWVVDFAVSVSNQSSVFPSYAGTVPFISSPTANNTEFAVGNNSVAQGLVVLCNTTQTVNGTALAGPGTNLAGLFQLNAVTQSGSVGITEAQYSWLVGASSYGLGVSSKISVFVMNSTAPKYINGSIPSNLLSPVVNSTFFISGNATNSSAPTSASNTTVQVLAPGPGDYAGVNGSGFLVDIVLNLNSSVSGYSASYQDSTTNTNFGPGHNPAAPGLVVLSNTTLSANSSQFHGASTNLAGLFQITGVNQANGSTQVHTIWQLGAAILGSGKYSQINAYLVNGTAPDYVNSTSLANATVISNNVTVSYYISAANGTFVPGAVNSTLLPNVTGTMKR